MANTIPISSIISSYFADMAKPTEHGYIHYLHYAFEAIREWAADTALSIKTVKLQIDNGYAELPDDFVQPIKVATVFNGRAYKLLPEDSIAKLGDIEDADNPSQITFYSFYEAGSGSYYYDGAWYSNLAFYRSPYADGRYRLDRDNGKIFVEGYNQAALYVEYESNQGACHCDQEVPKELIDYVKAYIAWREAKVRSRSRSGKMMDMDHEQAMLRARRKAFNRKYPINWENIRNAAGRTLPYRNE